MQKLNAQFKMSYIHVYVYTYIFTMQLKRSRYGWNVSSALDDCLRLWNTGFAHTCMWDLKNPSNFSLL